MGLATSNEEIKEVLSSATRGNDFYVGTDVKVWLDRFEILNLNDIIEKFSKINDENEVIEESYLSHSFREILHGNSYNWHGNSNCDIDFKFLQDENDNIYAYVRIHVGSDIRQGYTEGILLDLETYNEDDAMIIFLNPIYECTNSGSVEINNIEYSVDGNIYSEYLTIYNHNTDESIDIIDSIYEFNEKDFNAEIKRLVLENIKS